MQLLYPVSITLKHCGNKVGRILFDILFLLVLLLLCYLTAIIFYLAPYLFDALGRPSVDWGVLLLIGMPFFVFIPICVVLFSKPSQYCGLNEYTDPDNDKNDNRYIFLAWYIITIALSNLLTVVAFRFITTGPSVIIIPLISNLVATGIAFVCVWIKSCYLKSFHDHLDVQMDDTGTENSAR